MMIPLVRYEVMEWFCESTITGKFNRFELLKVVCFHGKTFSMCKIVGAAYEIRVVCCSQSAVGNRKVWSFMLK